MIEADLLLNLAPHEQVSTGGLESPAAEPSSSILLRPAQYAHSAKRESLPFLSDHAKPGTGLHQKFVHGLAAKDKEGMKAAAEKVAAWDFGQSLRRRRDQLWRGYRLYPTYH